MKELCLVSCSGGLDSTTTLAMLKLAGYENIIACHFDYGCRSGEAEKIAITNICKELNIPLKIFDISDLMKSIDTTSMLMDRNAKVTTGTSDDIKSTAAWVHCRNGLFMTIMAAYAESCVFKEDYDKVYFLGGFLNLTESGCFIPKDDHTITTFDNKQVKPLDIKVGDKVLSFNFEKKQFEEATVTNIYHPEHEITYKISLTFDEGIIHSKKVLFLSKEHPIYIKNKGWVESQNIVVGDMCYTYKECDASCRMNHPVDETKKHLSEEHRKHLSECLMGKLMGDKNSMFGHTRSNTTSCWHEEIHKASSFETESKSIDLDHFTVIEGELDNIDEVGDKVLNFMMGAHNGWIVEKVERIDGKVEMLNYSVEPNNNFFLNNVLTHNTYPDNSEYFQNSALEFFKYSTLIGNRIGLMYGLSDLMKFEQFALIDEFKDVILPAYKHAISCDRAKVIDGVPCNCMKDGIPACGSGLLSYWGSKMVGMDDTKIRKFYEVDDPEFKPLIPEHLKCGAHKDYDIHRIIDRIHFPKDKLDNLHKLVRERNQ